MLVHWMVRSTFVSAVVIASSLVSPPRLRAQTPVAPPPVTIGQSWRFASAGMQIEATVIATDAGVPSGMTFLPDGRILATNRRDGKLLLIDPSNGQKTIVDGLPTVFHNGGDAG